MNPNDEYEKLKTLTMPDLCWRIAQLEGGISTTNIARLALEFKQMEEKFKYEKDLIELQHKLNTKLFTKQIRWIKFSAVLNAIAIISGVLLGWSLSELKSVISPKENAQQTIQSQTKASTSASHSESKNDKIPSQPPIKDERYK